MKKRTSLITALMVILILLTTLLLALTTSNSSSNYPHLFSHTKAICNSENLCQDYEIFCKDQKIIKMSPITGAAVQFPVAWEDPRDEEKIKKVC